MRFLVGKGCVHLTQAVLSQLALLSKQIIFCVLFSKNSCSDSKCEIQGLFEICDSLMVRFDFSVLFPLTREKQ